MTAWDGADRFDWVVVAYSSLSNLEIVITMIVPAKNQLLARRKNGSLIFSLISDGQ